VYLILCCSEGKILSRKEPFYILIHNIDGPTFHVERNRVIIDRLAAIPQVGKCNLTILTLPLMIL